MNDIERIVSEQRTYFLSGATLSYQFRLAQLKKIKDIIINNQDRLQDALYLDLNKSPLEAYMSEIGMVISEVNYAIKHLKKWMKPRKVSSPITLFPGKSYLINDPYGVVLVMSPWNYPLLLTLDPVIAAIAGGNTVVVKPSKYSGATSKLIHELLTEAFDEHYINVVQGGREENQMLLEQKFDLIFFTGGETVGKLVMEKASKHLTPIILELGGKSPCIVDKSADIMMSAKKIIFGKVLNSGQTCVAPDYIYVDKTVKDQLVEAMIKWIETFLGSDPVNNPDYPKIINEKHYLRLQSLIDQDRIVYGGNYNNQKIAPTIIDNVTFSDPVMQEEIFGPIIPILTYENLDDAINTLKLRPLPLALYLFTNDKKIEEKVLTSLRFGGGCVNDTIMHLASTELGFGGVGESGMGRYHGKYSFSTFTHQKSVVKKHGRFDLNTRYHPYTDSKLKFIKKVFK